MPSTTSVLSWPLDVVLRPERLVSTDVNDEGRGIALAFVTFVRIVGTYFSNLLLYAIPLTLAGFGFVETATAPEGVAPVLRSLTGDPNGTWALLVGIVQNSAFLLVATLLTFLTFHLGVILAGTSRGVLQSLRAVSYSTGVYLSAMFTLVWHAATAPEIDAAAEFLVWLQAEFIRYFIEVVGANLTVPGNPPQSVTLAGVSDAGLAVLVGLLLAGLYYLYVLYVGARIGHDASRVQAGLATGFVLVSPALYAIGVVLYTIGI